MLGSAMKIFKLFITLAIVSLVLGFQPLWAQEQEGGAEGPEGQKGFEYGIHLGKLLPNGITNVTEIIPLWGFRVGHGWKRYHLEGGYIGGNGKGVSWNNLHAGIRIDMPIEQIVGFIALGVDAQMYSPVGGEKKFVGGGHVGGGVLSQIDPDVWFRIDMKFNINPGTGMYFGLGFQIR